MSRDEIITNNLGLVHACCKRFTGRGVEYDDLFQAGSVGLIKAVDGFDSSKGLQLSTYAVPVILGEIKRLFRDGGAVKVSRSLKELSLKASRLSAELSKTMNREPTVAELAEKLSVSVEELSEALCSTQPTLSLTYDNEGEESQIDLPVDSHEIAVSDRVGLMQLINKLPEKDRKIIDLRFYKSFTQQKTADTLGMTQVQVSRREKAILGNLRQKLG